MSANPSRDYFEIEAELKKRIEGDIRFDRYSRLLYSTDASIYQIEPVGVVVPRHKGDVQAVIEIANKLGVSILPRGGGTSLAGLRLAVSTIGRLDADVVSSSLQAAAPSRHRPRSSSPDRFIVPPAAASCRGSILWKPP